MLVLVLDRQGVGVARVIDDDLAPSRYTGSTRRRRSAQTALARLPSSLRQSWFQCEDTGSKGKTNCGRGPSSRSAGRAARSSTACSSRILAAALALVLEDLEESRCRRLRALRARTPARSCRAPAARRRPRRRPCRTPRPARGRCAVARSRSPREPIDRSSSSSTSASRPPISMQIVSSSCAARHDVAVRRVRRSWTKPSAPADVAADRDALDRRRVLAEQRADRVAGLVRRDDALLAAASASAARRTPSARARRRRARSAPLDVLAQPHARELRGTAR